eukprot:9606191-Alexandrium_andersonii.AAC.1
MALRAPRSTARSRKTAGWQRIAAACAPSGPMVLSLEMAIAFLDRAPPNERQLQRRPKREPPSASWAASRGSGV